MKTSRIHLALLGMALCGCILWASESVTRPVESPATLPGAVRRQLVRLFPNSELLRVDIKTDLNYHLGRTVYLLKGLNRSENRTFWLNVTEHAEVIRIVEEVSEVEVPPSVLKGLGKAFTGATINTVEKKSEINVSYLLNISVQGRGYGLLLSPEGNILEIRKDKNPDHANPSR